MYKNKERTTPAPANAYKIKSRVEFDIATTKGKVFRCKTAYLVRFDHEDLSDLEFVVHRPFGFGGGGFSSDSWVVSERSTSRKVSKFFEDTRGKAATEAHRILKSWDLTKFRQFISTSKKINPPSSQ